jgi:predicted enzyme related to lactoylglutathione lyase
MAKILGLGGIFFKSADPEKLSAWYHQWLGMDIAHPYGLVFKPDTIPTNGCQVWTPFKADTDYFNPSKQPYMFNLMVDDLDAMLAQIKPSGCEVLPEVERSEYGDFGWFIDPDGNKVELWQPPQKPPAE